MMRPPASFKRTDHHPFKVCSAQSCPVCVTSVARMNMQPKLGKDHFFGTSPAPFVGRFGYPYVNVGVLSPPEPKEDAWLLDAPRYWSSQSLGIGQIVGFRSSLINSHAKSHIKATPSRLLEISQEVGMAFKPVELELHLKRRPFLSPSLDAIAAPMGPSAEVEAARITANPKIPQKVDKVVSDTALKASDAFAYLYKAGFDEGFLSKLLSVGTLGVKSDRKMVPTRWSITASDDMLARHLLTEVKDYAACSDYALYFGGYLGNYFAILLFPQVWSYELFEALAGQPDFTTDYEPYEGRKAYVQQTAGGYYASRLPVLEKLKDLKRQASVLALRIITDEYTLPLGVWVVRESVRKALQSSPLTFASAQLMLTYVKEMLKRKFNHSTDALLQKSKLLTSVLVQKKLTSYYE